LFKYEEETQKWRDKKVSLKKHWSQGFRAKEKKNADSVGKLQFSWEGPYIVVSDVRMVPSV
jgi:hypothetical protein